MTLQRYEEERNGVQPNDEGNLVKYEDAMKIIDEMAKNHSELCELLSSGWTIHKAPKADADEGVAYYFEEPTYSPWLRTY